MALQGLYQNWFFVGQGRPFAIAINETGPMAVGQIIATGLLLVFLDITLYAFTLLFLTLSVIVISLRHAKRDHSSGDLLPQLKTEFISHAPVLVSAMLGAGYTRGAIALVSVANFQLTGLFGLMDKVQNLGRLALRPLASFFQGWISAPAGFRDSRNRPLRASFTLGLAGLSLAISLAITLPRITELFLPKELYVSPLQATLAGLTLFCIACSTSTGLFYLVPAGLLKQMSISSAIGSLIGVPLIYVATLYLGLTGSLAALLIAEIIVLIWQLIIVRKWLLVVQVSKASAQSI
jgi:hypothetical protein